VTRVGVTANVLIYILPPLAHEFLAVSGRSIAAGGGNDVLEWRKYSKFRGSVEAIWVALAVGVGTIASWPQSVANSATSSTVIDTTDPWTRLIAPGQALRAESRTADVLSSDSIEVIMSLRLFRVGTPPPGTNPIPPSGVSNPSGTVPSNPPYVLLDATGANLGNFTFSGATFASINGDPANTALPGVSTDAFQAV
jgi:hypothetical protein